MLCEEEEEGGSGYEAFSLLEVEWSELPLTKGQATKSARGMPWHQEPMKDATSCDKLRGAANKL